MMKIIVLKKKAKHNLTTLSTSDSTAVVTYRELSKLTNNSIFQDVKNLHIIMGSKKPKKEFKNIIFLFTFQIL